MSSKIQTYFIIAGEKSGDNHGADLMESLLKHETNINFIGIGGDNMIKAGLHTIESIDNMAVMGFSEVLRHLFFFKKLMNRLLLEINNSNPNQIILIDYPGFNLRLAKKIKKIYNIPITYYISPQLWAWKENRINLIRKYIDQMLVIFPFEEKWYKERGIQARFVGHPILNQLKKYNSDEILNHFGFENSDKIITLYPGSRNQEFKKHFPILLTMAKKLHTNNKQIKFILGLSSSINIQDIKIPDWIIIEKDDPRKSLECADLALVASGTSTLEAAVFGTPMIIIYKMSNISWFISKLFIKVKYAGMVNIIAESMIIPELLQNDLNSSNLYDMTLKIINNPECIKKMKSDLSDIKDSLIINGKNKSAAEYITNLSG